MKFNVAMNTLFVVSAFDVATLQKVKDFRPEALRLYKGEGDNREIVCAIDICSNESMSKYGFCFSTDNKIGEKVAMISKKLPGSVDTNDKARAYVRDLLGMAIVYGNQIEGQVRTALAEIDSDIRVMNDAITIAGDTTAEVEAAPDLSPAAL